MNINHVRLLTCRFLLGRPIPRATPLALVPTTTVEQQEDDNEDEEQLHWYDDSDTSGNESTSNEEDLTNNESTHDYNNEDGLHDNDDGDDLHAHERAAFLDAAHNTCQRFQARNNMDSRQHYPNPKGFQPRIHSCPPLHAVQPCMIE
jgi:hypothetical protein